MDVPADFPSTLPEFEERFGTEEQCRDFLAGLRWPDGFVCPSCGSRAAFRLNVRDLWECLSCRHQTSVTAGTIFHGTRKPLVMWFRAMFHVCVDKSGLSATMLKKLMGFRSDQTAWAWLHKLRKVMVRPSRPKLEGKVEVDETFVGGVDEGAHGRGTEKPLVAAAVERVDVAGARRPALGRVRLAVIEDATQVSTTSFAAANVTTGSMVLTDGLASYAELAEAGFVHRPRVIGKNRKNASKLLPGVHRIASLLKRWLLGTHQGAVRPRYLQAYLHEFEFRFNRRKSRHRGKLVFRLAELAVAAPPHPYREIIGAGA